MTAAELNELELGGRVAWAIRAENQTVLFEARWTVIHRARLAAR